MLTKHQRFCSFALGYMSLGMGQYLISGEMIQPMLRESRWQYPIALLGCVLCIIGVVLIGKVIWWVLSHYNQHNRIIKTITLALLFSVITGAVIGGIGQVIYEYTSLSYTQIKYGIWVITSIVQTIIKVCLVYRLCCFYHNKPCHYHTLKWVIGGIIALVVIVTCIDSIISTVLMHIVDMMIILGSSYYFINNTQ